MSIAANLETTTVETAKQLGLLPEEFEKINSDAKILSIVVDDDVDYDSSVTISTTDADGFNEYEEKDAIEYYINIVVNNSKVFSAACSMGTAKLRRHNTVFTSPDKTRKR